MELEQGGWDITKAKLPDYEYTDVMNLRTFPL